jgi:hypothetical protein
MSSASGGVLTTPLSHGMQGIRLRRLENPPPRNEPFNQAPGYHAPAGLWLFGNVRLLSAPLACTSLAFGRGIHTASELNAIESEAEEIALGGKVLVCGIHNPAHQRAAVVPLRWGAPRIVVLPGGFFYHLGEDLKQELFRTARLWRYAWDPYTDLAVSRRAPDKLPTFARHNPTVDRAIALLADRRWVGLRSPCDYLTACLRPST